MGVYASPNIVEDGLVLHLDAANKRSYEGSGTTWSDLSGNGNDGTLVNGPTYDNGNLGRFSVDSSNDYMSVSGLPTGNNWSVSLWYLVEGPTSFAPSGHRTFVSTNTFRFQWDDSASSTIARGPFADFIGGGQPMYNTSMSPSDLFNSWHMVSMTSNGSVIKCFFDFDEGSTPSNISRNFSTNGNMSIGINNLSGIGGSDIFNRDGGNCYFSSINVYNRALSQSEIEQNFKATRKRFGI